MTYLQFLLIFIVPLLILEFRYFYKSTDSNKKLIRIGILIHIILALVYTTPWDNYLVKTAVWSYSSDRIIGTIGYVPVEEYTFFILQTMLTGFWFYIIQKKFPVKLEKKVGYIKYLIWIFFGSATVIGFYFLFSLSTKYLGLILAWATPVILLQWFVGADYLLKNLKTYAWCLVPPTFYLWLIDGFAIYKNIWSISESQTTGIKLFNLPIEEALFFLVTNMMIIQGLILFISMKPQLVYLLKKIKVSTDDLWF